MGKAEVGTPKWIGNKIKSKGLQKLRWYCQMCQKQCRFESFSSFVAFKAGTIHWIQTGDLLLYLNLYLVKQLINAS